LAPSILMRDHPAPSPLVVDDSRLVRADSHDEPELPPLAFSGEQVAGGRVAAETALRRLEGPARPTTAAGEPVFAAPWESRAFGMAVALDRAGAVDFAEFQEELIAEISHWEATVSDYPDNEWSYYRRWLHALERIVTSRQFVDPDELDHETLALLQHRGHEH
jgi:nitrile hydratase accessory protein